MPISTLELPIFGVPRQIFGFEDDGWFQWLRQVGCYPEFNLENLRHLVRPDSICLDIGANIGVFTVALAALTNGDHGGHVHAFEGSETTFEALKRTVEPWSNVTAYPWIVGTDGERGEFVEDPRMRSSSHFMPARANGPPRTSHSIDSLDLPRVDFMKIDVEGGELEVLDGAHETIERCNPIVLMEFNSFAMVHYYNMLPRAALGEICEIFPVVAWFNRKTGHLSPLGDREEFLRQNMLEGFVNDLLCRVKIEPPRTAQIRTD